ncbi:MAG: Fic family protein, partial [Candidatus Mariimomonas ferrooxydans]
FVSPPPNEAKKAMGDLEKYMHADSKMPVLINCALIHYQFETIHLYLDGNGRLGRLLITFYLMWKEVLHRPLLYLSYYFKRLRQEYYDRLNLVRENGDYEQWIDFFLKGIIETSGYAVDTARRILELQTRHRDLLWREKISSPLAVGILEKLYVTPYVAVRTIAETFDISFQAASTLVLQLERVGILKEITGRKRDKRYVYTEYLNILSEGTKQ